MLTGYPIAAAQLAREIRAFNPWPVSHTTLDDHPLRVWQAQAVAATDALPPGTILAADKTGIRVACGEGNLLLEQIQPAGSKAMTASAFLHGRPGKIVPGQRLGHGDIPD